MQGIGEHQPDRHGEGGVDGRDPDHEEAAPGPDGRAEEGVDHGEQDERGRQGLDEADHGLPDLPEPAGRGTQHGTGQAPEDHGHQDPHGRGGAARRRDRSLFGHDRAPGWGDTASSLAGDPLAVGVWGEPRSLPRKPIEHPESGAPLGLAIGVRVGP